MASLCLQASQNRRDSGVDMRVVEVVPVFRPAHRFTGEQIQHHRQKSPAFAGPDVGHIAEPNLVRRGYCELPVEMVRYFNVFVFAAFVFVGRYPAAGDIQLFHQLTGQPAAHFDTSVPGDDSRDASGACRAAAGIPGFHDLAAFSHSLTIGLTARSLSVPVAAAMDFKSPAQHSDRISRSQPVDYREPLVRPTLRAP